MNAQLLWVDTKLRPKPAKLPGIHGVSEKNGQELASLLLQHVLWDEAPLAPPHSMLLATLALKPLSMTTAGKTACLSMLTFGVLSRWIELTRLPHLETCQYSLSKTA